MQQFRFFPYAAAVSGLLVALCGATVPAAAQDASPWSGDQRSAARLIAAQAHNQNGAPLLRGALEIRLAPGWKTYWRYPGDAGVPPHFDFAGSDNVRSVDVLWPAPRRFTDEEGSTIGYETGVVLPLQIVPLDSGRPATLRVKLDYAICEKMCVPAQASAELTLAGTATSFDTAVAAAEDHVPVRSTIGAPGPFAIKAVHVETALKPQVQVDVAAPPGEAVDLFAEGPTADWALPLPRPVADAPPGVHRFVFDLDGAPPGATPDGVALRLTATADGKAIEATAQLPQPTPAPPDAAPAAKP